MYIYIHIYIHIYSHIYMKYICIYICIYIQMYTHFEMELWIEDAAICMYRYVHTYIYIDTYAYVSIYTYIYIYSSEEMELLIEDAEFSCHKSCGTGVGVWLRCVAVCSSVLQCVAVCCNTTLQHTATTHCNTLQQHRSLMHLTYASDTHT